ncbi:Cleavage polyadenylation factor subunit clp1 [Pyricularia oryzae]|uniref:Polynucleotide 5'-hydroxyl-kinase GRC3 n=2 Tax=Pyricularia TaxID=48558 RepID=A0ABQ8NR82_PYRGI|nr:Cleavage polyadenylation factor subunit clp1 [Pyricularia oryzae]KAI6300929.1 Cleavage polyadenylation factor subunit clp1 [Pyricularia grisea]KAH9428790.1 Cleavage polyadenylation factor subunit clp1 [Pyricularia oryzae]KAI6255129.1 Cleavage polyadenylation factor subunit clp1 [Pyricularia oryzae]KAI6285091.1 Cleavage polyadenylation factor subunit clp1 [Pyricularia oryzae]
MSIPGLGLIPEKPATSASRTYTLEPRQEYRFSVSHGASITITLTRGTAERDGTELALNVAYTLSGVKSKILSWHGANLSIEGITDHESVAGPDDAANTAHLNLHAFLQRSREAAARSNGGGRSAPHGPRVLVAGKTGCGRTSLVRTLAAWATRTGAQPMVVDADPGEGLLTLPGTLSAAVFGTVMDVASEGGWGAAPSSGPSAVPVKLPLVFYYGRRRVEEDRDLYKGVVNSISSAISARAADDPAVRSAGMLIDTPPYVEGKGADVLVHIAEELNVNIIVTIDTPSLHTELTQRFSGVKNVLGEHVSVVALDKSSGVMERDEGFLQHMGEASIKEYFFGDAKITLSPFTQQVAFDELAIYTSPEASDYSAEPGALERIPQPLPEMAHWVLAMMDAAPNDPPHKIRYAPVSGFVYVAAVDKERRRMKILAPVSGRLGDKPLVWGKWPEPHINLLG